MGETANRTGATPTKSSPAPARAGLLERTFTRLLMRPACVVGATNLSANFRLIDFHGETLRDCAWSPGDKVQVKLDGGFITRTYTPITWDRNRGKTQFLAFCHGAGPGSEWARHVEMGDERQFFGPRGSLSLDGLGPRAILFGDETSFALAIALKRASAARLERRCVFEVNDPNEAASILEQLEFPASVVIQRRDDDAHLPEVARAILDAKHPETSYILSGKAPSIQYVSRALKSAGVGTRSMRTKAYWAPGKVGLD